MTCRKFLLVISFSFITKIFCSNPGDITGIWLTFDKETNEPKSQVEIYKGSDGKYYGKIYDPESGKTYKCKAWFEDNDNNKLFVRGYIGFSLIGRNVQWVRESKKR